MVAVLCAALFIVGGVAGVVAGIGWAARQAMDKAIRDAGLTRASAGLYGRAVRILRRLHGLVDLDGDIAGDLLTPESKRLVDGWVADHRALVATGEGGTAPYDTSTAR